MLRMLYNLGRNSFLYILGDLATQILAVVLIPVYTRALPPADYGLLGIVSTVQKVMTPLLGLGVAGALTRFYFDSTDERERRRTAGAIWLGWITLGALLLLFFNLVGPSLSNILFKDMSFRPYIQLGIWIAALNALATIPRALLRAQEKPGWFSSFSVINFAANTLLIIHFVVYRQQGAVGSLRGQLLGNLLVGLLYVGLMAVSTHWTWDTATLKSALTFGLPLVPHLLASWALTFSDRWILQHHVSLSEIGLYTLAYQFGLGMSMILTSINRAWSPFFYKEIEEPEGPALIPRMITYYVLALAWIAVAVALLARPVIFLIADETYHGAHRLVPLIAGGYLVLGLYFIPTSTIILYSKRTSILPLITGLAALLSVALNLFLIPRLGVFGAALDTFVGYAILFAAAFPVAHRLLPLAYEYRRLGTILLVTVLVFTIGYLVRVENPYLDLLTHALWLLAYPLALLLIGFFTSRELSAVRCFAARWVDPMKRCNRTDSSGGL
jgi:O-antigen/teichoic acid export membrane protein